MKSFPWKSLLLSIVAAVSACGEPDGAEKKVQLQAGSEIPVARAFIFPVQGKSTKSILDNFKDPRVDGWFVNNDFGSWCDNCGGLHGYHPGEDWNMTCSNGGGGACDLDEPVYAAADGIVTFAQRYVSEEILRDNREKDIGMAVVIKHQLPIAEDLSKYILAGTVFPAGANPVSQTIETGYLHLEKLQVVEGQMVKMGDKIGHIGLPHSPHLHFEIRWKVGNRIFSDYKASHQVLTDRGLLVPTAFIQAHVKPPYVFKPTLGGGNPTTCATEPTGGLATNWIYNCNRRSQFDIGQNVWGLIGIEEVMRSHCFRAYAYRDGVYQFINSNWCNDGVEPGEWTTAYHWISIPKAQAGAWRIDYYVDLARVPLTDKPIATSSFTVGGRVTSPPPQSDNLGVPNIPPSGYPKAPTSLFSYSATYVTCPNAPQGSAATNWVYTCSPAQRRFSFGQDVYGLVGLERLTPKLKFKYAIETYRDGRLQNAWTDPNWYDTGLYGWDRSYAMPSTTSRDFGGSSPPRGQWVIRTLIVTDRGTFHLEDVSFTID